MRRALPLLLVLTALGYAAPLWADEFRPALLEIRETEPGRFAVLWKVPLVNGRPLQIAPVLPGTLTQIGPVSVRTSRDERIEQSVWQSASEAAALIGSRIEIEGLSGLPVDVILQIELTDASTHSAILRASTPTFEVPEQATRRLVATSYWKIGTIHILEGYDHLLFVLALLIIIPDLWMLLKTITAFTLAHSVSLALATLGWVNMPGPPTEAVIALSIVFLAVEIVHIREGRRSLTARYPWVVALAFGLVHGLGFAGALAEVGLPQGAIPLALLMFNVGVETGQLLFVAAVLLLIAVLNRLPIRWPAEAWRVAPYTIGSIASFWTIERIWSFI